MHQLFGGMQLCHVASIVDGCRHPKCIEGAANQSLFLWQRPGATIFSDFLARSPSSKIAVTRATSVFRNSTETGF